MPGVGGYVHLGARRHMRLVREGTFGECPAVPSWQCIPIIDDGMKLKATNEPFVPNTNIGGDKQQVVIPHLQTPNGPITFELWPEVAQFILDMALERDANLDIYSYCIDHYTPPDPRRYLGAVVNTMTLTANGTGDGDVRVEHDMMAQKEQENDSLVEGDFDYTSLTLVPFMFRDAHIEVHDTVVTDVEVFTITVENNVVEGPNAHGCRAYLIAGRRRITLDLTKINNRDRFNRALRAGDTLMFEANFTHPDGHLIQIQIPKLYVPESDEDGTPDTVAKESPRLMAAATAAGNDIIYAVDLGPATTTLAPLTTTTTLP